MFFKRISLTFLFLLSSITMLQAQEKFTISGTISDQKSNESLYGVNIIVTDTKSGATTNEYGFYSITLPKGIYKIEITSIGFKTIEDSIELNKNTKQNFKLTSSENVLKEVIINSNDNKTENRKPEMSVNKL